MSEAKLHLSDRRRRPVTAECADITEGLVNKYMCATKVVKNTLQFHKISILGHSGPQFRLVDCHELSIGADRSLWKIPPQYPKIPSI